MKIGVLAGTQVDTKLGVQYVISKGYDAIGRPCSEDAKIQLDMQLHHKEELAEIAIALSLEMIEEGADGIFVYCNSLSTAIDLEYVRSRVPKKMVTPLDVYVECAKMYKHIFVITANGQSLAGIERIIKANNPDS